MIKQLQRKFAIIAMLIIFFITGSVFIVITAVSYNMLNSQLDQTLNLIIENDGYLPEYREIRDAISTVIKNATAGFSKYFSIKINSDNEIIESDIEYMPNVDEEEVQNILNGVLEKDRYVGYYENYRYKIVNKEEYKLIVFLDCEEELETLQSSVRQSIIIIITGLLIACFVVFALTKRAIRPLISNIENQKQFITNASHELKTPLAVITADVDVLEMTIGEDNEWINSIKSQANRLNVLVKSMLSLSNIEKGKQDFKSESVEIISVIKETLKDFKALLQSKNVEFDDSKEIMINADINMMKQLVTIFLDNAIKYTPDNGKIKINVEKQGKYTKMEFSNTCENVKNINVNKLFDRFYRGDKSRNKTKEGYGIGLSIAQSIVQIHHGKISAYINKEEMICFKVLI